jgi:SSS family solute:Na+ symporter
VLTQDVIAPLFGERLTPKTRILISRILIVVIGLYVLYWGLLYKGTDDIWDYMAVTGAVYFTGAFALLLFGLYWKQASSTGAVLALLAGFTAVLGLSPVQEKLGISITSARVGLISVVAALVAMVVGSLLFPDGKSDSDPALKAARGKS